MAVAALLVASGAWVALAAASAAESAKAELNTMIAEATALDLASLNEPGTYSILTEQSLAVLGHLEEVKARFGLFRPLEFVPVVGGRVEAARNTVEVGVGLAHAAGVVLSAYGNALDDRQLGGQAADGAALGARQRELDGALVSLARASTAAERPLVLSDKERGLVVVSIGVLRSLATVAIESPQAVDDGFAILEAVQNLQGLVTDPIRALSDTGEAEALVATLLDRAEGLSERLSALSEASDDPVGLAIGALAVVTTSSRAAGELLGAAGFVEEGLFSEAFGANVGPKLTAARDGLARAARELKELEALFTGGLGVTLDDSGVLEEGSDSIFVVAEEILEEAGSVVEAMRSLLGYDAPRTYLLLLQNQDEIRATGGFLGATAEIPLSDGVLGPIVFSDSLFVDRPPLINNPPAPVPLYWYLWMGRLLFRDANWNPDFPNSAETLMELYESGKGTPVDGAIASTKLLALDLMDVIGPIPIPGLGRSVTGAEATLYIEGELEYECEERHVSERGKRCFDEDLLPALLQELRSGLDEDQRTGLIDVVVSHLERKDVLLNFREEVAQRLVVANGWAGSVGSPAQDVLMVVDSSLPGHTLAAIQRTWHYSVSVDLGGTSQADLALRFQNHRPLGGSCRQAKPDSGGCYWNFVRVLLSREALNVQAPSAPLHEGSEKLTWGHRELETSQVLFHGGAGLTDLAEVGAYLVIEPGQVLTMPISYDLGPNVVRSVGARSHEYRLQLLKQPGINTDEVEVQVALPAGSRVISASPEGSSIAAESVSWDIRLTKDTEIVLVFESP